MAVENALLGLLRREPRHGYELAREFAPDTPLGEVVHLEMSMLYALLKKLERDGLRPLVDGDAGIAPAAQDLRADRVRPSGARSTGWPSRSSGPATCGWNSCSSSTSPATPTRNWPAT